MKQFDCTFSFTKRCHFDNLINNHMMSVEICYCVFIQFVWYTFITHHTLLDYHNLICQVFFCAELSVENGTVLSK